MENLTESVGQLLAYKPIEITQLSPLPDEEIRSMAIQTWIEILAVTFDILAERLEKVEDERREVYKANPSCDEFSSMSCILNAIATIPRSM